ncbi:MAG TPA: hypothetical protein VFE98_02675 [Candidatus Bathyarchaeia archaeon]|nr:hypothetical protein [Candidatus Bathyarchaeia archaeon]
MAEYAVHTVRVAKKLEWFGLTILKRYLNREGSRIRVEDVHNNPQYFSKGIDFILHDENYETTSIDVKVDSYYGSDPNRKIRGLCNPDSGFILLETISQLQYDRTKDPKSESLIPSGGRRDVPGWFFTGQADEIYYYYIALLNDERELNPIYADYAKLARTNTSTLEIENKLLRSLRVERDLLVSFGMEEARKWYESAPTTAFQGFAAAPNPTYLTLSRRAHRENFISNGPGKSHGPIFPTVIQALS